MKRTNEGISLINYGELHRYYPLKLDTTLPFDELCNTIGNSSIIFKDEYQDAILNALGTDIVSITDELNSQSNGSPISFKLHDYDKYANLKKNNQTTYKQELRIELSETENSLLISLINTELEAIKNRILRIQHEYKKSSEIYGNFYVNSQRRFLLLPLKLELYNKETVWLFPILYVFSNNMAILKLEFSLIDVSIEPLKMYDADKYITAVSCTWDSSFSGNTSLDQIRKYYINALLELDNLNRILCENFFQHIILVDFEGIPTQIDNIPNAIQEDIFRIVSAPVPDLPTSYKTDALNHFKNYSWGTHNIKSVIKTNGGCISFCDKLLLDYASNLFTNHPDFFSLDTFDYLFTCNNLARDIQINVEFALLIIMLKKLNQSNDLLQKQHIAKDLASIKKEYYNNIIFISTLQENCYGTVNEQVSAFEKMMSGYMKSEIIDAKLSALDQLIMDEEQEKVDRFQNFISIGSLLITAIFGLPSIYETLGIIRAFLTVIDYDIPYLTQTNTSIFLWILILFIVYVKLICKK